ncbi:MAG: PDZ domain-containing protein [Candidatus Paralactobacillus gallistercoris]|uniref:PDZ domain-containing protein n=1 Tax=Candidatus Paralactobacillus gallistercoris TaxID=2838724 RepID=A0A948TJ26_9LACO|nr:PDZ domain-containing protein [Candidatus Paralactobacillus gallistercoris]
MSIIWWQPILWVGILVACYWTYHRIQTERHYFHSALQSHWQEMRRFWWPSIIIGLLLSILLLAVGLVLPLKWLLWVELLGSLGLLLSVIGYQLPFWLLLATLGYVLTVHPRPNAVAVAFLLSALVSVIGAGLLNYLPTDAYSPELQRTQRGKLTSSYRLRQFYLVPLIVFIPGNWLTLHLPLMHSQQHVTIFVLPLILGFTQLVKRQLPFTARQRLMTTQIIQATLCLLLGGMCWWQPRHLVVLSWLAVITSGLLILVTSYFNHRGKLRFNQVPNGLRVIAVLPHTPAAKMDLHVGDVIIACNQIPVTNEKEFYYALQKSPTFCHLRVQDQTGEFRILESAIFNDSPYEIGVVTFK